jgi:subtilisin family serine protease
MRVNDGRRRAGRLAAALVVAAMVGTLVQAATASTSATDVLIDGATAAGLCATSYPGTPGGPDQLSACQWDMAAISAGAQSRALATGLGVRVGVIDSGIHFSHPDLAGGIDAAKSCSFINTSTPTADPAEVANGNCSNKGAIQDLNGHGTHVATTIGARVNGIGIVGVAPQATIVALKACTIVGFCFADSVAAALRYAGDQPPGAVAAHLCSSATPLSCPTNWPAADPRQCTGGAGATSFFGAGLVNALAAASR